MCGVALELNRLPASQRHKTCHKRWKRCEKPQAFDVLTEPLRD